MTQHVSSGSEAERQALAMLVTRFSADRDALAAAVQRTDAALRDLGGRLDALTPTRDLDALRFELGRLEALVDTGREEVTRLGRAVAALEQRAAMVPSPALSAALPPAAVEDLRAELQRMGADLVRQAVERAEQVAGAGQEDRSALEAVRAQVGEALAQVRRLGEASGEQAARAAAQAVDLERRARELEALRMLIGQGRDELLRRIEEHEARLGVRLDSITVGAEAETRSLRDSLWDRLAGTDRRLDQLETQLASIRVDAPKRASEALDGLVAVHGEMEQFRHRLGDVHDRLAALEVPAPSGGLAGVFACLRDELVAATMLVVSLGAVVGRLALSLAR